MCVRVCVCVLCHISTDIIYIATRSASARHGMAYGWRGPSTARNNALRVWDNIMQ
jgi:hypothetical protein